jgi:hypothetical protein
MAAFVILNRQVNHFSSRLALLRGLPRDHHHLLLLLLLLLLLDLILIQILVLLRLLEPMVLFLL